MFSVKKFFFFLFLVGGVMISISSDSWFGAWCGLELNLMSFVPLASSKENTYSTEAVLKYFLVQALGSAVIVVGSVLSVLMMSFAYLMGTALLLKMGAAPLHFWFPQVMGGLGWFECFILMSIQKISPMVLLSYVMSSMESKSIIFWSSIISALVGSLGGLNQLFLRKIMSFSSINHMAWMLVGMSISEFSWVIYYLFYVFISASVVVIFYIQQVYHISQMSSMSWSFFSISLYMSLLSLGGLPPFTGFVPKWILLQEMVNQGMFFSLSFLLFSALVSLYYYLRLTLLSLSMVSLASKGVVKKTGVNMRLFSFLAAANFLGLFLPSLFYVY